MDVTPTHFPGDTVTCHAEAAVTGGRFVAITGPRVDGNYQVSHATAAGAKFGVAARDKGAGDKVMVIKRGIVGVTAAAAITAGQEVEVGANGQAAVFAAGIKAGVACDDAALGELVLIDLYLGA